MATRRSIFGPEYGTAPIPKSKGRAPLPPPDMRPGVPLSMNQAQGQPQPQNPAQAAPGGPGEAIGSGADPNDPDFAALLQRLLAELGDRGGMA